MSAKEQTAALTARIADLESKLSEAERQRDGLRDQVNVWAASNNQLEERLRVAREALGRISGISCGEIQLEDEVAVDDTEALGYIYKLTKTALAALSDPTGSPAPETEMDLRAILGAALRENQ